MIFKKKKEVFDNSNQGFINYAKNIINAYDEGEYNISFNVKKISDTDYEVSLADAKIQNLNTLETENLLPIELFGWVDLARNVGLQRWEKIVEEEMTK